MENDSQHGPLEMDAVLIKNNWENEEWHARGVDWCCRTNHPCFSHPWYLVAYICWGERHIPSVSTRLFSPA
eukprot:787846-Pleurochrysis_carterae.AAC.1